MPQSNKKKSKKEGFKLEESSNELYSRQLSAVGIDNEKNEECLSGLDSNTRDTVDKMMFDSRMKFSNNESKPSTSITYKSFTPEMDITGSWNASLSILKLLSLSKDQFVKSMPNVPGMTESLWATILVLVFLEKNDSKNKGAWSLIERKSKAYLQGKGINIETYRAQGEAVV